MGASNPTIVSNARKRCEGQARGRKPAGNPEILLIAWMVPDPRSEISDLGFHSFRNSQTCSARQMRYDARCAASRPTQPQESDCGSL